MVGGCAQVGRQGGVSRYLVMRGLDPRIHLFAKWMDCRVEPGNDALVVMRAL